ncbi:MAG: aspartate aminotransferase family protein [Nitrospinota bacterium]|jgi:adenosylmethionine-8-amino-7-oxononanoate transaminase|nr:aspartate aminotransferase family protein [Nitrospinota bacterium]
MTRTLTDLDQAHRLSLWTPYIQMETVRENGPLIFERAEGSYLYDASGKKYLDAHASLWLVNVGYGRQEVIEAVYEQMKKMAYFSMFLGYSNPPAIELGERLKALAAPEGMGKVFYSDSGSEAVETALKMVRQYWKNLGKEGKYKVIGRRNGYHGVTFGALSASGMTANRRKFEPLLPGFRHIPEPNCYRNDFGESLSEEEVSEAAADALRAAIAFEGADSVAAFIAEPIMGAAGVIIPPETYLKKCREICTANDVLFIADEVITGFGRTGTWFGSRTYGIQPDIMCFAKGLTSGYVPMGATMCTEEIYQAFLGTPGDGKDFRHGNTYSGHAAAAAAALANLAIVEKEDLPGNAAKVGAHLLNRLKELEKHPIVGDVRGLGLLARVELVRDRAAKKPFDNPGKVGGRVRTRVEELGVIFRNVGDILTISPPLILTAKQADVIVDAFDQAIGEVGETF